VARYRKSKSSYQWMAIEGGNDAVTGTKGVNITSARALPPLEGKVVRWVGHFSVYSKEPSGGNGYTCVALGAIQPKEFDDNDWIDYWRDYNAIPDWTASPSPDDFPLCVPVAVLPLQYISLPFDLRSKRRWHRGEVVRFGLYTDQPGASDAGISVRINARILLQFD